MGYHAESWAAKQKTGKAGAKAILMQIAAHSDFEGKCWIGIEALADITEMGASTVRAHLKYLENDCHLIVREERRREDGTRTTDYIWLMAPDEALDSSTAENERLQVINRQISAHQPPDFSGQNNQVNNPHSKEKKPPKGGKEKKGSPVTVDRSTLDPLTGAVLDTLTGIPGWPKDDERKDVENIRNVIATFPDVDPISVANDLKTYCLDKPIRPGDRPRSRYRNFARQQAKWAEQDRANDTYNIPESQYDAADMEEWRRSRG